MQVLNLYSERFRTTPIDLFVEEPFEFNATYDMAIESTVEDIPFRYVDINTLIHMKEAAGRPVDQEDVRQLRLIAHDDEPLADH